MTSTELRAMYTQAYRIIKRERSMREHVFRNDPAKCYEKLVEIDLLLTILTDFKDALKEHVEVEQEQMALIPPPARYE